MIIYTIKISYTTPHTPPPTFTCTQQEKLDNCGTFECLIVYGSVQCYDANGLPIG
jgi:hypothetical protein